MKKNIINILAVCGISALLLTSCTAGAEYTESKTTAEYNALLRFTTYCKSNEGLEQNAPSDPKQAAKYYIEQDSFSDVTDYDDIETIDSIVYNTKY